MSIAQTLPPGVADVSAREVSIARLHGEACWHCGAVHTALRTVGQVATAVEGGHQLWPVVACPEHRNMVIT